MNALYFNKLNIYLKIKRNIFSMYHIFKGMLFKKMDK
ncbi:hypothetical protein CWU_02080 [Buchnera aphidicola str. JF98 (Acyrthosiphon pisum)]|nr:hypothetical protein CWU_02080 [Buchnera aphidicola str. JF98 (Acyrthosiphon pisum)]